MAFKFSSFTFSLFAGLSCLAASVSLPAYAEGSADLISSGGDRPYLEFKDNQLNGGILRRTVMKVYAAEGETIDLGSSAVAAGLGSGVGVINYRDPNNVTGTCGVDGFIANRAQEIAGPSAPGGFTPCTVTVGAGQTGIWEIDFVSPDPTGGGNPTRRSVNDIWTEDATKPYVTAWDITVRSSTGTAIPGRVYANYYALNMGGNSQSLSSQFRVLTKEGYQYRIDLNGLDPFGFIFFANRNGFFENVSGDSIFRSLQFTGGNPGALPPGYSFQNPNDPDVGIYVTHKTFINTPDSSMPSSANSPTGVTWLYTLPAPPPTPTNFAFTGIEGTVGQAGTAPLGGTLSFDSVSQSAFSITIDLNEDNIYGNANDRTFIGRSVFGANSVFWDGLDGNGDRVPPSAIPYTVRINQYAGEAHFPMIDAEHNPNGMIIQRLNQAPGPTSPSEDPFNIYYDDRNNDDGDPNTPSDYSLCADGESADSPGVVNPVCDGNPPSAREALTGINSSSGGHEFSSNFGNRRGMDTWVYYPSTDVDLSGGIVVREADLIVDKDVDLATANPGDELTYTITVTNDGPNDEDDITFRDTVPASLSNVTWDCVITSGTGSCDEASGSGNNIDTTLNLDNQAVATYTVSGDLSLSASGTITNSATAIRNRDITDPNLDNNTDDAQTVLNTVAPPGGTVCYAVADDGDRLVGIDINSGSATNIGPVGVTDIEAIAYWPITNTLYAADAGQIGTLNTSTGTYSNLNTVGSGNGSAGFKTFSDIDGLAFHPYTGELYGSVRDGEGSPEDLLIKIEPSTGLRVSDAFGPGVDYLVIQTATATGFSDVDDIAFDPQTGFLYAIANEDGSSGDRYVRVDTTTGAVTAVGTFGVDDVEGLTSFNDGTFYATTGDTSQFYSVNKVSGVATPIGSPLTAGSPVVSDYESVACLVRPPNEITGTVFFDTNIDAAFNGADSGTQNANVRLYRDANGNGVVDGSDVLIVSQNSLSDGTYSFLFAANGAFVLDVDPTSLPSDNNTFTTDNLEAADFGSGLMMLDDNNDFGHFTDSNLALVKRITAINGVRLTDSVDDPNGDDNHPNWPSGTTGAGISTFLAGATQRTIEPGDEVEYTIYYLATGNFPVTNVMLCDRVPENTDYITDSMVIFTDGNTSNLTDTDTDNDGAEFLAIGDNTAVPCPGTNDNGTVSINLAPSPSQLPNATGPGTPGNSYGFIRFRVTVE
ncbi:MAG: DUF11 domain-containing protein [Cyanobacteria bacterium J06560_6]